MSDTPKPLEFKIKATPSGYQVEAYRASYIPTSTKRTKTLLGARLYVWNYKRRLRKMGQA